jgi:ferredoxin-NADP reductase
MIRATLHHIEDTTPRLKTFWFKPEQPLRFDAGQYTELTVPHANADGRGPTRWMSLVNAPGEKLLGVLSAFPPNGSTYKHALLALKPGDDVTFGEPIGDFVLPKLPTIPLTFIIGGIGIAPVRSLISELRARNETRAIQLIYSVSSPEELAYREVFESYPMQYTPIVTRGDANWKGLSGHLTAERALQLIDKTFGKLIYLCGPQSLIEPLFNDLLRLGVPRAQLILDYFPGY